MSGYLLMPIRNRSGAVVATAMIDHGCEHLLNYRWHMTGPYASRTVRAGKQARKEYLHRAVMGMTPEDGWLVDHINNADKLDCRRSNLRVGDQPRNQQNRTGAKRNSPWPRGVALDRRRGVFTARCTLDGRTHWLGSYPTVEQAARAAAEFRAKQMPWSPEAMAAAS